LAVAVAARTLGLEHLDPSTLVAWYGAIVAAVEAVSGGAPIPPDARSAVEELGAAVAAASTTEGSVLADAARSLPPDELTSNAAVMLFGAIETSEGATSNALAHLLTRHDRLDQVRRDRRLVESIVEESLRLEPAATRVDRYATSDVELAGVLVRRGDLVIVSLTAANRDPGAFTDPDELDLRRADPRSHLTFAQGPHACPGAQLARLETRAAIEAVLDLLADVHLTETPIVAGAVFRKPRAVQVAWTCGTTDGAQRTSNVCEPDQDRPASTTTGEPTTAASTQT
jgi:cytochrome P450